MGNASRDEDLIALDGKGRQIFEPSRARKSTKDKDVLLGSNLNQKFMDGLSRRSVCRRKAYAG